jgi:hypothetical protein
LSVSINEADAALNAKVQHDALLVDSHGREVRER